MIFLIVTIRGKKWLFAIVPNSVSSFQMNQKIVHDASTLLKRKRNESGTFLIVPREFVLFAEKNLILNKIYFYFYLMIGWFLPPRKMIKISANNIYLFK